MTGPSTRDAVVFAPMRVEQAALRTAGTPVVRSGMGPRRAAAAAARHTSGATIIAGVGGGLAPGVRPGDVVVASELRGPNGEVIPSPAAPLLAGELRRAGLTVHLGPIFSSPHVVDGAARRELAATGALAVDTESVWLAPRDGRPFVAIRSIVDTDDAPLIRPGTMARGVNALRALRRAVPAIDAWAAAVRDREVWLANPRSFCAGVERAIDIVDRALDRFDAPVYVRRQIVHNAHVVRDLEARGAIFVTEVDEVPPGSVLVLAAHGVSPVVRAEAAARSLTVIDATCPLVTKVHNEVRRYAARDTTVFLIGHDDHEEVEGTVGEAPANVMVIGDVAAARSIRPQDPEHVAYAMQTTLAVDEAEEIAGVLRERFPSLRGPRRDDICYATTNRQAAVRAIARECDFMLVVGSSNSSNSLRLVEVAEREGVTARLVDDAGDIDLRLLANAARVGVTAGASTPPHLVEALVRTLDGLGSLTITEPRAEPEDLHFTLPKEVS